MRLYTTLDNHPKLKGCNPSQDGWIPCRKEAAPLVLGSRRAKAKGELVKQSSSVASKHGTAVEVKPPDPKGRNSIRQTAMIMTQRGYPIIVRPPSVLNGI